MAKAGMRRPDVNQPHGTESNHINHFKNQAPHVEELQGRPKTSDKKAKPIMYD